jgi:hypothetical protein
VLSFLRVQSLGVTEVCLVTHGNGLAKTLQERHARRKAIVDCTLGVR